MSRQDFEKYLADQKAHDVKGFDAGQQLQDWRDFLAALYEKVSGYMEPYISQGSASISYKDIELNEEFSGPYTVQQLILQISNSVVTFKPIGTMLIGSKGRVDVTGPRGTVRFTLVDKNVKSAHDLIKITTTILGPGDKILSPQKLESKAREIEWVWKITSPPPSVTFTDLNDSTFFDVILSVVNV